MAIRTSYDTAKDKGFPWFPFSSHIFFFIKSRRGASGGLGSHTCGCPIEVGDHTCGFPVQLGGHMCGWLV